MRKLLLFLICIIVECGYSMFAANSNIRNTGTTIQQGDSVASASDQNDTLKIKYIPEKVRIADTTLQQQKIWMEKWAAAMKENRQKDAIEALEKAASYDSGEACYRLGEIYKYGKGAEKDPVKSDSLFYYSAIHGYKPGIDWLNSGEGVFMPGEKISLPQFPGGEEALIDYICKKSGEIFRYPDGNFDFQGVVLVRFIVEKDGSIKHAKVIKKSYYGYIEKGAIDIVKNMPEWKPALWEGQPVRSFFVCPIVIKLI